jgi:PAS domain S-box-containing protein
MGNIKLINKFYRIVQSETDRKLLLLYVFSSIGILALTFFGLISLRNDALVVAIILFTFILILLGNLLFLVRKKRFNLAFHVIVALLFVFEFILFFFIKDLDANVFWFYIFPPLAILVLNNKKGTIYSFSLLVLLFLFYIIDFMGVQQDYSIGFVLRFALSYSIVGFFINILEFSRKTLLKENYKIIDVQNDILDELRIKYEELTAADEEMKQSNEELKLLNENVDKQNIIIRKSEKRLQNILDSVGEGITITDFDEKFVYANPAAHRIFEVEQGDLIGRSLRDFIDDRQWTRIIIQSQRKRVNHASTYEVNLNLTKNKRKHIIVSAVSDEESDWSLAATIAVFRDITNRVYKEKRIVELKKQLEILLDNLPAHVYYKDDKLRYIQANQSFADLFSINKSELIGKKDVDFASNNVSEEYENLDKQIISTKKPINNYERLNTNPSGNEYWSSTSKIPYFDDEGNIKGIIGIVSDITERKRYQLKILKQKEEIEAAHKDITDSINYAKTIQDALLPKNGIFLEMFKENFVLYRPKEKVSGDFYYYNKIDDLAIFAVADCTGHGVPGGFLTMLGVTNLHDILKRKNYDSPSDVLNLLRLKFKEIFSVYGDKNNNGLDIALCFYNIKSKELQYSGAYSPLFIIRNNELIKFKAVPNPIGYFIAEKDFKTDKIKLQKNDVLYLFSDGYQDQFGGENLTKYSTRKYKELLMKIHKLPMKNQKQELELELDNWKGSCDQIDDITVMGIKF